MLNLREVLLNSRQCVSSQQRMERCVLLFPFYAVSPAYSTKTGTPSPKAEEEICERGSRDAFQLIGSLNDKTVPAGLEDSFVSQVQLVRALNSSAFSTIFLATRGSTQRSDIQKEGSQLPPLHMNSEVGVSSSSRPCSVSSAAITSPPLRQQQCIVVKFIELGKEDKKLRELANREIQCHQSCNFFSIPQFYGVYTRRLCPEAPPHPVKNPITAHVLEMEYANNGDLSQEIRLRVKNDYKLFSERNALLIFEQVLLAVDYLHDKGIIHRDIKAGNVFLCSNGLVKLGDFGLSKFTPGDVNEKRNGSFVGTASYITPEMWERKPYGGKADIFSLGVLLYEIFTLRKPFVGKDKNEVRQNILKQEPKIPSHVSPEIASIVLAMLQKEPDLRPSAMDVLLLPLMRNTLASFLKSVIMDGMNDTLRRGREIGNGSVSDNFADSTRQSGEKATVYCRLLSCEREKVLLDLSWVYRRILYKAVTLSSRASQIRLQLSKLNALTRKTSQVLIEGEILKENSGCWKLRHLCLRWATDSTDMSPQQESAHSGVIELILSLKKDSAESTRTCVSSFIDCFEVLERYAMDGAKYVFALLSRTGKTIFFQASSEEERQRWISFCLASIQHNNGLA
ncbi:putative serine/threonine protein kinase [Trypanosoma cruzi]|uniref:non-specific serine/threonine protein kinase n=2 Tax=Trypanosoma cruzi TaxID=5693 RepID=Q4DBG3_TRYCC|nr:serine/threonine protein kinase, putative [Trypanosoma cruzi]EAN89870.1 serine/threonine protein kinase, putative [Trypanosoma cruzi]PWV11401.1 putative serine/threonine protein kinase [Trypanosoma cruzi]|eukprot:XP_811721.1 serine/threonine protein kinase [Trypanosoma cruzi strain CL Brener]